MTAPIGARAAGIDAAIGKAAAFLRDRLRSGAYGLAWVGSDGAPRFSDNKGHVFVASFIAEAMTGLFDEIDRTIVLVRILSEEDQGLWGFRRRGRTTAMRPRLPCRLRRHSVCDTHLATAWRESSAKPPPAVLSRGRAAVCDIRRARSDVADDAGFASKQSPRAPRRERECVPRTAAHAPRAARELRYARGGAGRARLLAIVLLPDPAIRDTPRARPDAGPPGAPRRERPRTLLHRR